MTIEFCLLSGETVLLKPVKVEGAGKSNRYNLIDENEKVWIELELTDHNLITYAKSDEICEDETSVAMKLDELYYFIIETEKSGADGFSEGDSIELNPYDPEKIKVRSDKIPITLISQMIDVGDINLYPDFQRHLVWNTFQKSRLIESILLRIPLPMFYFSEDFEGKLSVVDGLQRISAIKDFMNNKFPLRNLQYLEDSCGGRYYTSKGDKKGIDSKYFRWFNLTNLSANIIDPTSPYKVKYDIFRRINTGGKPLNNQEIRNCFTGKGLRDTLKTMIIMPEFKSATDNSIKGTRMDDQEIALRFLVFCKLLERDGSIDEYSGYMETVLDEFTEMHVHESKVNFEKYICQYSDAMKNAEYLFGRKYSFRKILPVDLEQGANKQLINKALFVCVSLLLRKYEHDKLRKLNSEFCLQSVIAETINNDNMLYHYLSYGTNGKANLLYTYNKLQTLFEMNLKYE